MKSQSVSAASAIVMLAFLFFPILVSCGLASQPILSGDTKTGSIVAPGGFDAWTVDGSAGDRIVVAAVRESGTFDTDIFLYAPGGGLEASTHGFSGRGPSRARPRLLGHVHDHDPGLVPHPDRLVRRDVDEASRVAQFER
jgi:hypothetical protein